MSVFQVDATNELVRAAGSFTRTEGTDEIRQGNQVGVQIVRGEIPTNLGLGFPWFDDPRTGTQGLLRKGVPPEVLASRLRKRIEGFKGVVEVLELEVIDDGDRKVSIPYTARISEDALARALLVTDTVTVQT